MHYFVHFIFIASYLMCNIVTSDYFLCVYTCEYSDPIVCLAFFAYKGIIIWLFMNNYDWIAFKNNIILLSLLPILCGTMYYCGVPKLPNLYAVCP